MYNVDETGVRPGNIVDQKGKKQVSGIATAERGELIIIGYVAVLETSHESLMWNRAFRPNDSSQVEFFSTTRVSPTRHCQSLSFL